MSNASVIDKYSKAAFKIAKKAKLSDVFVKDLNNFSTAIAPFLKELSNPVISGPQIENIIADLAKKLKINKEVSLFLITVGKARRIAIINKIAKNLESLVKRDNNILEVELICAHKLKADQIKEATKILDKKYPKKDIEINEIIKKDILGGVVIKIGSTVIDGSVKNQLENIAADCRAAI